MAIEPPRASKLFPDGDAVDRALARAVREALRRHKLLGQSVVVWRDGRVVEIPPEEIEIPPEDESPTAGSAIHPATKDDASNSKK